MNDKKSNSFLDNLKSVLGALFGIQSDETRQRDFKQGDPAQFILLGVVAVLLMVITLIFIVQHIISSA